jgi:hypothetical protein
MLEAVRIVVVLRSAFASGLIAAALAGCGCPIGGNCRGTPVPASGIDVKDDHVFVASVRVSWDLVPPPWRGSDPGQPPSQPKSGGAVELEALRVRGDGSQSVPAGEAPVGLGHQTFPSPQDLHYDFRFTHSSVYWRQRGFFRNAPLGAEALIGLAHDEIDLAVSSSTHGSARQAFDEYGPFLGFGAIWRVRFGTSVQARYTYANFFGHVMRNDDWSASAQRLEGTVAQALGRHASLRAGYAWWRIKQPLGYDYANATPTSDIRIGFHGPSLGLDLQF